MKRLLLGCGLCLFVGCAWSRHDAETRPLGEPKFTSAQLKAAKQHADFNEHIKPILEWNCTSCHNPKLAMAGWDMTRKSTFFASGARGVRVIPGNVQGSLMSMVLKNTNHALRMPAVGNALRKEEVEMLNAWIAQGAEWPNGETLRY